MKTNFQVKLQQYSNIINMLNSSEPVKLFAFTTNCFCIVLLLLCGAIHELDCASHLSDFQRNRKYKILYAQITYSFCAHARIHTANYILLSMHFLVDTILLLRLSFTNRKSIVNMCVFSSFFSLSRFTVRQFHCVLFGR